MSWDEFGFKKGELAFVAQNYETNELITILDNRRQTTIRNYFLKYPLKARQKVQFITMDMSGAYIPLAADSFQTLKSFLIVSTLSSTLVEPFKDKNCYYEPV